MLEDTPELRRLVKIADLRRARFCQMSLPSVAMIESGDPEIEEMHDRIGAAQVSMYQAETALLEYLLAALNMPSELPRNE